MSSYLGGGEPRSPGRTHPPEGVRPAQDETRRNPGNRQAGPPDLTHAPGQAPRTMMGRGQTWRGRVLWFGGRSAGQAGGKPSPAGPARPES